MRLEQIENIRSEIKKVFIGKDRIIDKVLMAILAGGHIILDDAPGVGKTTLAAAFSKVLGLTNKRIQFTPDTMPSDITGFSIYDRNTGQLEYKEGAAFCQLLLADEINRTSPKTQAALLEIMEEGKVTIDGITHELPQPFCCIATQNPYGSIGTQALPDSQLDRFTMRLSIGYPSIEDQVAILKNRKGMEEIHRIQTVTNAEELLRMREEIREISVSEELLRYITKICEATRSAHMVRLGVSPRGIRALLEVSKAHAVLEDRDYLVPEDVQSVFRDVCEHRMVMQPHAETEGIYAGDVLEEILETVKAPSLGSEK